MKAKLTIDGKEFEVEISEEQAKALTETKKKTGYERVEKSGKFHIVGVDGECAQWHDSHSGLCELVYKSGNYYSDETIARNNARADKLYKQLRRFAVEHREEEIDWNDKTSPKYYIAYGHRNNIFDVACIYTCHDFGAIYFDSRETAQLAVNTFKDELIWYFTEYKDSL